MKHLKNYWNKQWDCIKYSFHKDNISKLMLIDLGFIVTLLASYVLIFYLWGRNLLSISSLINGISSIAKDQWGTFIMNLMLLILLAVILYILIISLFSSLSVSVLDNKRLSLSTYLRFVYFNTLITLAYIVIITLMFAIVSTSTDPNSIQNLAVGLVVLSAIYIYFMLISFFSVHAHESFARIFHEIGKLAWKLHHTLVPIFLSIILLGIISSIIFLIPIDWVQNITVLITLLYCFAWFKKYMHKLNAVHDRKLDGKVHKKHSGK